MYLQGVLIATPKIFCGFDFIDLFILEIDFIFQWHLHGVWDGWHEFLFGIIKAGEGGWEVEDGGSWERMAWFFFVIIKVEEDGDGGSR
mgnify:CR=1 FL=1